MIWLYTKPKVKLLEATPIGWFYLYKNGTEVIGTRITIDAKLLNDGAESSHLLSALFESGGMLFRSNESLFLKGRGMITDSYIMLDLPINSGKPERGKVLHGTLKLKPWGNKRLCCGQKYLTKDLEVKDNEGARVR